MRSSVYCALMAVALATPAMAKLPPLNDEAKAKAAETTAKAGWADKVGLYKHCLVTDRIANAYRKTGTAAAAPVAVATATSASVTTAAAGSVPVAIPACADPGPFAMPVTPVTAKPLEAAGAHSPSGTAVAPPSTKATAAEVSADPKARLR